MFFLKLVLTIVTSKLCEEFSVMCFFKVYMGKFVFVFSFHAELNKFLDISVCTNLQKKVLLGFVL